MSNPSRTGPRYLGWLSLLLAAVAILELLLDERLFLGTFVIGSLAFFALFCMGHPFLKSYAFTVWVFAFVAASMFYPQAFMTWGGYDLGKLIVPLIQIIMFGMGTTLSVADFTRVLKMPWPVFIGFGLQFTIMPLVGFMLAKTFGFTNEIAAGVVLIGCCPSGVASNVMAYLAGGDVALSVTITSLTTLAAPVMTPLWMKVLAGAFVEVQFLKMMFDIINMIIVPIIAGLIANRILFSRRPIFKQVWTLVLIAAAGLVLAFVFGRFAPTSLFQYGGASFQKGGLVVGFLLIAAVTVVKLVVSIWLRGPENWIDKALPLISMAAICCIIAVITARSRNDLLTVGPWLIGSSMIHNLLGYTLAYGLARAIRLKESACRTVAFEVGMQNGGMASALAMNVLKSPQAALASAIFGPWQNISGSILATYWHRKPIQAAELTGTLSMAQAQRLLDLLSRMPNIPFDYPRDCCFSRAHEMCYIIGQQGFACRKVWFFDEHYDERGVQDSLRPTDDRGLPVTYPDSGGHDQDVRWIFHVAPLVIVKGKGEQADEFVIDPSMSRGLLSTEDWIRRMGSPARAYREYSGAEAYFQNQKQGIMPGGRQAGRYLEDPDRKMAREMMTKHANDRDSKYF